jgi:hypothetical protein
VAAPGVRALPDGDYGLRLAAGERELVARLARELEELVAEGDTVVARLFPPAYRDDEEAESGYRELVGESLVSGRLQALRLLGATATADRLSPAEADAWCTGLNDLRLVLGERLGVTEESYEDGIDPNGPDAGGHALYVWLTWLQASVVDAIAARYA